jgi:hypothetical protein
LVKDPNDRQLCSHASSACFVGRRSATDETFFNCSRELCACKRNVMQAPACIRITSLSAAVSCCCVLCRPDGSGSWCWCLQPSGWCCT